MVTDNLVRDAVGLQQLLRRRCRTTRACPAAGTHVLRPLGHQPERVRHPAEQHHLTQQQRLRGGRSNGTEFQQARGDLQRRGCELPAAPASDTCQRSVAAGTWVTRCSSALAAGGSASAGTNSCYVVDSPQQLFNCAMDVPYQHRIEAERLLRVPATASRWPAVVQSNPGANYGANAVFPTTAGSAIANSLGRPSSAGAATVTDSAGEAAVGSSGRASTRWTCASRRSSASARRRMQGNVDTYNVLNSNTPVTMFGTYNRDADGNESAALGSAHAGARRPPDEVQRAVRLLDAPSGEPGLGPVCPDVTTARAILRGGPFCMGVRRLWPAPAWLPAAPPPMTTTPWTLPLAVTPPPPAPPRRLAGLQTPASPCRPRALGSQPRCPPGFWQEPPSQTPGHAVIPDMTASPPATHGAGGPRPARRHSGREVPHD